jgi:3-deoxy-manno-octulosonate cytidylyltransferase (CMP-KDO synthetase)
MNFIVIIPSRYGSTRFPGKPLANIGGKTMIQRVYEQALKTKANVWVATDDERIVTAVQKFGGNVVITSTEHRSGTDRCAEAVKNISVLTGIQYDVVINVQGDEPFVHPDQIELAMSCFTENPKTEIATLMHKIYNIGDIFNPANAKVIIDNEANAIYFSRAPIPFVAKYEQSEWLSHATFYNQVGLYAYRTDILHELTLLPEGNLERAESLEQLRWLENGYKISTRITKHESISIDSPEDLEKILAEGVDSYLAKQ